MFAILTSAFAATLAAAEELPITAFFGRYQGSAVARTEDSRHMGFDVRDLDVVIAPKGSGSSSLMIRKISAAGRPSIPSEAGLRRSVSSFSNIILTSLKLPSVAKRAKMEVHPPQ